MIEIIQKKHICAFPAPNRVWYPTKDGLWGSREWRSGEKEQYEREVLGRKTGK